MDIVQLMENDTPKAMATVVEAVDGLENYPTKAETDKAYIKVPTVDELWAGGWFMNGSQTVTPKKKLSECANGWLIVFSNAENDASTKTEFQYLFVHKRHVKKYSATGIVFPTANYNGAKTGVKYLYITDTNIKGNDLNGNAANKFKIMTEIYEW
ncbi:hypothetical protein ACFJZD_13455 [Enterococcus faecalis]|uniref:hypothetical protein n=1 Tax=Enterococcus faecalis TaxID=1351 RepID=UPI000CF1FB87|nr:hypothetical protein [Enterococcus faecalis]EGO5058335.1 hypothetical protein [Enterococcus faecalis]EGO7471289.1 hypothetical protein [Enterococcus faecalis]EGO8129117.1 hypothetical protein [Enterococcus faecalis]EGO8849437.1 hypothetical protein [Enterococcus faecalis]EGO8908085.1 hypothetical protein [Enterococcus faecalis]